MLDYSKTDKKLKDLIKKVSLYMQDLDYDYISDEIYKAYDFAKEAHEWQVRLSWDPYLLHPVDAALILADLKPDLVSIKACILHDVIEDTDRTIDEITSTFWKEVAFLCEWLKKLSKVRYEWEERNIWSLRKMFVAMAQDLRVIFIKLSDRLHNMRTLKFHPKPEKQERIALETLNIYAPIADRLWLYTLKNNLEEECFKFLEPIEYRKIKTELHNFSSNINYFYNNAKSEIEELLKWEVEKYAITYRVKSVYSIYKKIKRKWYENVESMYDLFWIKILLEDIPTCYKVLWLIHSKWSPIPNRFKDYIALPKPNWYRSLHTTIIGFLKSFRQQPTEIQIKTFEMDEYADIWVAAHFEYKEKWSKVANDIDWVKELKSLTENLWNIDFMSSLKIDVFKDRIFVFTPKWLSINLPAWSTAIDFAYAIHSEIWNHTVLAKIDWRIYPLDKELNNWDVIEIITDSSKIPSPFRLSFVKTTRAKDRIRSFLNKENKDINVETWKSIINRYLEKINLPLLDKEYSVLKVLDWKENDLEERISILEQVWNFSINPSSVIRKIMKTKNLISKKTQENIWKKTQDKKSIKKEDIIIGWEKWINYKVCKKCISLNIPNKIVWHINSKWVVTVHNRNCSILKNVNKERLLPAYRLWEEWNNIIVSVSFVFIDKIWIVKELSEIIYSMSINIEEINSRKLDFKKYEINLKLEIPDHDYLLIDRVIDRVKLNFWGSLLSANIKEIKM